MKVVKTSLTSEMLKPSGIKTGRKNEDDLTEENEIFLKERLSSIFGRHWTRVNLASNFKVVFYWDQPFQPKVA